MTEYLMELKGNLFIIHCNAVFISISGPRSNCNTRISCEEVHLANCVLSCVLNTELNVLLIE
jgi:hypothetical protein